MVGDLIGRSVQQTAGEVLTTGCGAPLRRYIHPTLADVPSTLGEASVASLDARSPPSCGATEAALAAADAMGEARGGHTEHLLA